MILDSLVILIMEKCQYCKALFFIWWSILENIGENDSMVLISIKMEDI